MASTNFVDKAGITYVVGKIKELLGGKVDKADGKGLSTNDYTTAEKTKLSEIETGAQVNMQADWNATSGGAVIKNKPSALPASNTTSTYSATGTEPVNGKAVASAISGKANKANTLSGYGITDAPTKTEMSSAISSAVAGLTGVSFSVVESLPTTGKEGVIYLVAHAHGTGDSYDEYIWLASQKKFEKLGNTDVNLSGYVKATDLVAVTNTEIDAMFA